MKFEKLTENKIRVILNLDDIHINNFDLPSFMADSSKHNDFFGELIHRAEKEVGFLPGNSRLLIEAVASIEGNFVFTITKVADLEAPSKPKKKLTVKRKTTNLASKSTCYAFESFDEFCNFCSFMYHGSIKDLKNLSKSICLYCYNDRYYLVVSNINTDCTYLSSFYASISEFAKLVNHSDSFEAKLLEHGKLILKNNAITRGIEFFVKK